MLIEAFAQILVYGLSLWLAYLTYQKYDKVIGVYITEVFSYWPRFPKWLNWGIGIMLATICIFLQVKFLFASIFIWLFLLFVAPFFFLPIKNVRYYNLISVINFVFTAMFAIIMFVNVNNSRDIICKTILSDYRVYYTTEMVEVNYGDAGKEYEERQIAHVNSGNKNLDFFLEKLFPYF